MFSTLRKFPEPDPLATVTGVILAGGASRRMGSNKALLPYRGGRFIEAIQRQLSELFPEVLIVTNTPEQYSFLPQRKVPDIFSDMGVLAGIHAGLSASRTDFIFTVACDMPYLDPRLIRHLARHCQRAAVVVPHGDGGIEPLHAFYHRSCLPAIEKCLEAGKRRIVSFFDQVQVHHVPQEEIVRFDPDFLSFKNINTPSDYYRLRGDERGDNLPDSCGNVCLPWENQQPTPVRG